MGAAPVLTDATRRAGELRRQWWRVLIVTGMSSWLTTATFSTVNIGFTDIRRSFPHHSVTAVGWVITAYAVMYGALLLPAGRLADRYGRLRVYTIGLALFGFGGVISAWVPGFELLVACRVIQGAGAAIMTPSALGLLLEVTDARDRVRAITLFSAFTTIGGASGPTVGALIIQGPGWRWAIAGPSAATLLVWWFGRPHLPNTKPAASGHRLDALGVVLATASMGLLVYAISEGDNIGWGAAPIVAAFVGAALSIAVLIVRSCRHPAPVIPTPLFRSRTFSVGTTASLLLGVMGGSIQLLQGLFLRGVWGYSALRAGLAITPAPLFASLFSPLAARVGSRYGERATAIPGTFIMLSSILWYLWRVTPHGSYWSQVFPAAAANGIGVAFAYPMVSAAAVRDVTPRDLSIASAVTRAASQVGQSFGVALLLVIIGSQTRTLGAFHTGWWFLVGSLVAAMLLMVGLGPPKPRGVLLYGDRVDRRPEAAHERLR